MTESRQLIFLAQILQLCETYDGSVTSWIRSGKRNKYVGGSPTSRHLTGAAVDIVLDDPKNEVRLMNAATKLRLISFREIDHVHIQMRKE